MPAYWRSVGGTESQLRRPYFKLYFLVSASRVLGGVMARSPGPTRTSEGQGTWNSLFEMDVSPLYVYPDGTAPLRRLVHLASGGVLVMLDIQQRKLLGGGIHKPDEALVVVGTCDAESVTDLSTQGVGVGKKGVLNFDGSEQGQALAFAQSLHESRPTAAAVVVPLFNAAHLQFVRHHANGDADYSAVYSWTAPSGSAADAVARFAQYVADVTAVAERRKVLLDLVEGYRLVCHLGAGASGHVYGAVPAGTPSGTPTCVLKTFGSAVGEPDNTDLQGRRAEEQLMSPVKGERRAAAAPGSTPPPCLFFNGNWPWLG